MLETTNRPTFPRHRALRPVLLAAALALGTTTCLSAMAQGIQVPASAKGTLLSVSAHAETRRTPDIAHLSTGVTTKAADAGAAMQANAQQMEKVVAAIKAAGIAERDIQTSGVNLNPQYRYADDQPPAITGYEASNTVDMTVRDIAKLGKILDALVEAGANQINGPTFDVEDKQPGYDEARRKALDDAQKRAQMYAKSLDMRVLRIASISEGNGSASPRPMPMMDMARMEKSVATPIQPGENTLSVDLDVVFELGK